MIRWWRRKRTRHEALDALIIQGEALSVKLDEILADLRASRVEDAKEPRP